MAHHRQSSSRLAQDTPATRGGASLVRVIAAVAFVALGAGASAQSLVGWKFVNKTQTQTSVSFDKLTFSIVIPEKQHSQKPNKPQLTLDLYDEDGANDEGVDTDRVETSPEVTVGPWELVWVDLRKPLGYTGPVPKTLRKLRKEWRCIITVGKTVENDVTDPRDGDNPDPAVKVNVKITGSKLVNPTDNVIEYQPFDITYTLMAPDLPSVGSADYGLYDPSRYANSQLLAGEPIAALSRGLDPISRLPNPQSFSRLNQAALYFVSDQATQIVSGPVETTPGQVFVLNLWGDLWPEEMYAADVDPDRAAHSTPRYLNITTAPDGSDTATDEIYFVREGSDQILYSPTGDPAATSLFLDVAVGSGVTGLAVEDIAPRGAWSQGDRILFALEGSSAIYSQAHGGSATPLSTGSATFDGTTTIGFDHFDRDQVQGSLQIGHIRGLAVAAPTSSTPEPADRMWGDVVDEYAYTYGAADGGRIGFRGIPQLGATDFRATLHGAAQGTWAQLCLSRPLSDPGVSLPPSISSSKVLLDLNWLVCTGVFQPTVGGFTEVVLPIPADPSLEGLLFGFQWAVLPQLGMLPLSLSDAGAVYVRR